jgi:hypothetical protein
MAESAASRRSITKNELPVQSIFRSPIKVHTLLARFLVADTVAPQLNIGPEGRRPKPFEKVAWLREAYQARKTRHGIA